MPRLIGIETEYGILAPEVPDLDPAVLSAAVVDSWDGPATHHELDGSFGPQPDPVPLTDLHTDQNRTHTMRSIDVMSLRKVLTSVSEEPNRVLGNGARFYVDHAHPEYSAPEVTTAVEAVRYDLAGEAIVAGAAARAAEKLGTPVRIHKNNTDSQGSSYGCHENYLLARSVPWQQIVTGVTAFLVSRTVVVGAGRVGIGRYGERPGFQLSQRADFFETPEGIQTTRRRPIVNTRDEPHAPPAQWRRLHVITGDANRSPWSTWLKVGSAALVLEALAAGRLPELRLVDPVDALHTVSHDPSLSALLELEDGRRMTALELQWAYLEAVAPPEPGSDGARVLLAWAEVLDDLAADPGRCADRLDWVAKLQLLESYADRHRLPPDSPRFAQLDLAWAELGPASPFAVLSGAGRFRSVPGLARDGEDLAAAVARAVEAPPSDTRAWLRGSLVQHDPDAVVAASWDWMVVQNARGRHLRIDLSDPLDPGTDRLDAVLRALAG